MQFITVRQNYLALPYISNPAYLVLKVMVESYGFALGLIDKYDRTEELSLLVVQQNGLALEFVENQTKDLCMLAVLENVDAFQGVQVQNH